MSLDVVIMNILGLQEYLQKVLLEDGTGLIYVLIMAGIFIIAIITLYNKLNP